MAEQHELHPMGKCTEEVKSLLPPEMKTDVEAIARMYNRTMSEHIREVLAKDTYGVLHLVRMQIHAKP